MEAVIPMIDKDYFFTPGKRVHIQISNECRDYLGVFHRHEFIEVVYILSGRARHMIGTSEFAIQKGDITIINPGEAHAFFADKDCGEEFLAYDLMFTPDFVDSALFEGGDFSKLSESFLFYSLFPDNREYSEHFNLITGCGYELGPVFDRIYHEYKSGGVGSLNLIRIYTAEIVIRLMRRISTLDGGTIAPAQRRLVAEVIAYIEQNYNISIHNDEIASKLFFNQKYIAKLFKLETGRSIHEFVREIRIKEVCRLLVSTNRTVADIASDCGFSDMKSFYALFKKQIGCTPKIYREKSDPNTI